MKCMKIYVVKQGDSVDSIAESQGIPVETLVWANQKMCIRDSTYASPKSLHQQLKVLVCERGASLEKVLNLLTKNPARVLGTVSYTHLGPHIPCC